MTLLTLAVLLLAEPSVVRVAPGGPVLIPPAGLVIDRDGSLLRAERLAHSGKKHWAEAWRTARGTIVLMGNDGESIGARAYGPLAPVPRGLSTFHYPCATRDQYPIGGPMEAGAIIAPEDDGSFLVIRGWSGAAEWRDELTDADMVLGGAMLSPSPGTALIERLGLAPTDLSVHAVSADGRFAYGLLPTDGEDAPTWFSRAALGAEWTGLRGLPGQAPLDVIGAVALFVSPLDLGPAGPFMVDLLTGEVLREPRGWMVDELPSGMARRVTRSDGPWFEWRGMSVNPVTGGVRICWDDPQLWAPAPDGQWSAVLDAYRPAAPVNWAKGPPESCEAWLAVVPAGSEQEAPMLRPQARWAQPVARAVEGWPPLHLAPVWSLDGRLVACGERVFRADSGQMAGELAGTSPWPIAFTSAGSLLWLDRDGDAGELFEWSLGTEGASPASLSQALPLPGG